MDARERIAREIEQRRNDPDYEFEVLLLEVNRQISALMKSEGVRKVDLAGRLGVSRAFITKLLRGETNVTLKTLVRVAIALNAEFKIQFVPVEANVMQERWTEQRSPRGSLRLVDLRVAA